MSTANVDVGAQKVRITPDMLRISQGHRVKVIGSGACVLPEE
jgi:S-adenosylmethionine:diacylglycerol 3-amino-3-carboxypropyl transferase